MDFTDYYEILEVSRNSSDEIIKAAYRTMCKKYHPDTFTGPRAVAEERIRKINEAYQVLGHPADKRRYDALYDQRRKTVARLSSASPRREAPKGGHSAGNSRGKRDKHTRRIFLTTFSSRWEWPASGCCCCWRSPGCWDRRTYAACGKD